MFKEFAAKVSKGAAWTCVHLLYPPLCLNCQTPLTKHSLLFCAPCLELISLAETAHRCRSCFGEFHKGRCERCIHRKGIIHRQIAACEKVGPSGVLLSGIYSGNRKCISAAASLMAYQWLEQKEMLPEILIPLPLSFWQKHKAGIDFYLQLAKELGKIFSIPVLCALKKKFDRSHFLKEGGFQHSLYVDGKKGVDICDRRILLVATELDDSLFRCAGKELKALFPAQVDALAFAAKFD